MNKVKIVLLIFMITQATVFGQELWWQRENPVPTESQLINPNYLSKKREIEILYDDIEKMDESRKKFHSLGHKTPSLDEAATYMKSKLNKLEYELSNIPVYINRPPQLPNKDSNIETNVIINTSPETKKDLNANLIQGTNLQTQIVFDELKKYIMNFSIEDKIKYYELFIKDYENTSQAKEANDIIKNLAIQKENKIYQEKEYELKKLEREILNSTGFHLTFKFDGYVNEPKVSHGLFHNTTYYSRAKCTITCNERKNINKKYFFRSGDRITTSQFTDKGITVDHIKLIISGEIQEETKTKYISKDSFYKEVPINIKKGVIQEIKIIIPVYGNKFGQMRVE